MTAFCRFEGEGFSWEIRSVNLRGLDVQLKIPAELRELEQELVEIIREKVTRGRVQATLRHDPDQASIASVDRERMQTLIDAFSKVTASLPENISPTVDLIQVLHHTEVLTEDSVRICISKSEIIKGLRLAVQEFSDDRRREGAALSTVLHQHVGECLDLLHRIGEFREQQVLQTRERLQKRIQSLGVHVEPDRLAQEVAITAQRSDVTEEMERLQTHFDELSSCLDAEEATGRRMTFLTQELAREANTLSAKINLPEPASIAVDLKVVIDQIREQVQNIE